MYEFNNGNKIDVHWTVAYKDDFLKVYNGVSGFPEDIEGLLKDGTDICLINNANVDISKGIKQFTNDGVVILMTKIEWFPSLLPSGYPLYDYECKEEFTRRPGHFEFNVIYIFKGKADENKYYMAMCTMYDENNKPVEFDNIEDFCKYLDDAQDAINIALLNYKKADWKL